MDREGPVRVLQVNVSPLGGLPKHPVSGHVRIHRTGVEGDHNRYRTEKLHGDLDSAVLLIPLSTIEDHARHGFKVGPGSMGENLTLRGVDEASMAPGQRWRIGTALLEITRACTPCSELEVYGEALVRQAVGKRGWYARVLEEGEVAAGDAAVLLKEGRPALSTSV
jgi:MOSC domain-containing protein YiiM